MEKQAAGHRRRQSAGRRTTPNPWAWSFIPISYPLCIWPELETISTRKKNPFQIRPEDIDLLNFEVFPFWVDRTVMEVTRKTYGNPECQKLMEGSSLPGKQTGNHFAYHSQLWIGVGGRFGGPYPGGGRPGTFLGNSQEDQARKDFYKAVQLALSGIITYARD